MKSQFFIRHLLFLCLLVSSSFSSAQTDSAKLIRNIKAGIDSVQYSFKQSDWTTFTNLMHPTLIEMTGGKEGFQNLLKDQISVLLKDGSVDTMATGNVLQILKYKGQWQCIVESFMQLTVESITISTSSCNVGVSFDGGASWKFIRVSDGLETKITTYFPDLSPALKVPLNQSMMTVLTEFIKNYKVKYPLSENKN